MADPVMKLSPEAMLEIAKYGNEQSRRQDSAPSPMPTTVSPMAAETLRRQQDFAAASMARKSQGNRS